MNLITKTGDMYHRIDRIVALQKVDDISEQFHIRVYLVSDSTYNIPFDSIHERDLEFDRLLNEWTQFIQVSNEFNLQINRISDGLTQTLK